ncbi:hypothetical protein Tsubulata_002493 [Turnera subulata]|uniref:Receptor-like serine/threonine-protein kinase n=1 Tax=Turnera subulata TaxID=218843 RepID=A0A9Q0GJA2_9ROSI|nr:hypothetical protein Tsubulata_002493 [Turnera subulata]
MALTFPYYVCFLLLLVHPFLASAQTSGNISLGASLSAKNDNSSWLSPSGDFAFGFRQVVQNGFLLAIWFNKIPEQTIVWSANRNSLVPSGSTVQLTSKGLLILNDKAGRQIWTAISLGTGVTYAAMLDTGNFVLASNGSVNLWESFDEPTDTILPTQIMNQGTELIANYLETNYSNGRFKFMLQGDGNLILYTVSYPFTTSNAAYWSTQSSIPSGYQVVYNQTGYIYLIARNGTVLNPVLSNPVSAQDFYQRATIDYDGILRQYVHLKPGASSSTKWPVGWNILSFIPGNICLRIEGATGSGACGYNSYCSIGNDQRPSCQCPEGYSFVDPNDVRQGCKQDFVSQSCDLSSPETDSFSFVDMPNTDWPLSDYEYFGSSSEDWCRQACLGDCYCDVAIFRDGNCWKKKMPLSNGRMDPSTGGKALIKVRTDNSTLPAATSGPKRKDRSTLILTGSVLLGFSIVLNVLSMAVASVFFSRSKKEKEDKIQPCQSMPDMNLKSFTYEELKKATGDFQEELGSGAFGTVYKGAYTHENGKTIAVKRLDKMVAEGEQEFKTEVKVIGRTNHKNLVQLVGFCNEGQHRLLVYEYMSNGSLATFLFGDSVPNWYRRTQIAFAIARGLLYLHEECSSQIIHCDIKPQNILLDESLTPKISDFGLAKLLKTDQTRTTTALRGTKGYVAPEWFKNLPVTAKIDVYSFGILLLELICRRRNFDLEVKEQSQIVLADYAYDCYKEGKSHVLVEDEEEAVEDMKKVERFLMVAIWCIQEEPSLRPAMKKVVQMLEGAVHVPIPPDPASFIGSTD